MSVIGNYPVFFSSPLFRGIPDRELFSLLSGLPERIIKIEKNRVYKLRGDRCEDLMFILDGLLAATFDKEDGKTILVEHLKAPDAVASAILFSTDRLLPVTLTAEKDTAALLVSDRVLLSLFQRNRTLLKNYLEDMGNRVVFLADKIRYLSMKSLREKISGYILELSKRQNSEKIRFDYSLDKLSELFSVARPSLSRELSRMREEGLLRREKRSLIITDRAALSRFFSEN